MADTVRTDSEILGLFADNITGLISPQDVRDAYVSLLDRIANPPVPLTAPVNQVAPLISGAPREGVQSTVSAGTWIGNPTPTITRQWLADGLPISGATALTFTPTANEVGEVLTVTETAMNSQGTTSVTSAPTAAVLVALVADETVGVFASMVDGAVVYLAAPGTTLIGSPTGLAIRSTGDIYLSNRDAFIAALPFVAETSALDIGFVLDGADYYDFAAHQDNMHAWFDATDQRHLLTHEETLTAEEVRDKTDALRKARNDLYADRSPTWVRNSQAGTSRPALDFAPALSGDVYGLFFQDSPIYAGLQRLSFVSTAVLETRWDNEYSPNEKNGADRVWPRMTTAANDAVAKMCVVTIIWRDSDNSIFYRLNGQQVFSQVLTDNDMLHYTGAAFIVFYANNAGFNNVSQIFSSSALGQGFVWKNAPFRGQLFEIINLLEVNHESPVP